MTKTKIFLSLMMTVVLLVCSGVFVHASDNDITVTDYIDTFCESTKCESVSVVVVCDDDVQIYGDADGLYQIGSMTKAFTGLGIQKLISDGVINEDDTVSKWLPGFTAYYENEPCDITVRQLLTQTSGYTNREADYPSATENMPLRGWAYSISEKELSFRPGTEYSYSNVNYNLLGAVIEQASGKNYKDYMETEILIPLGLNDTYAEPAAGDERIIHGSRLGYRHSFTYTIPVAPGQIPAGYFYSNASDMARWIQIWTGTADIPEEYRELVNRVKQNLNDAGDYYSGWELFENETIGHSGGTPNYSSRIVFSDKEEKGVCVLTNMNVAASTDSLCNGIYAFTTGGDIGNIETDVWTVFDIIFTMISVMGLMAVAISFVVRHKGVLIGLVCFLMILLISVCIFMPVIFGAGLDKIIFTWAPYSFAGGLLALTAGALATEIKLLMIKNYEN